MKLLPKCYIKFIVFAHRFAFIIAIYRVGRSNLKVLWPNLFESFWVRALSELCKRENELGVWRSHKAPLPLIIAILSGQNRRNNTLYECIFDNMALLKYGINKNELFQTIFFGDFAHGVTAIGSSSPKYQEQRETFISQEDVLAWLATKT